MFEWIAGNAATIISAAAVLIAAGIAVFSLVRQKKRGSRCAGDCSACGAGCPYCNKDAGRKV